MKSSLIWRFALIIVVLLGWIYSIFPLHDRDLLVVFEQLAQRRLKELSTTQARASSQASEIEQRLSATGADASADAEWQRLNATATAATAALEQFDTLMAKAREQLAANPNLAPYMALRDVARGGGASRRIVLSEYVPVPTQRSASNALVLSHVRRRASGKLRLGLDLRGGTEFVIGFNEDEMPADRRAEDVRDQIVEILRNRVDTMGVVEPEIKPVGPASLSLRMPSVSEGEKADIRRTIQQTARLEFRVVDPANDQKVAEYMRDPEGFRPTRGFEYFEMEIERPDRTDTEVLFLRSRPEPLEGGHVKRAVATFNEFGTYAVSLAFNSDGAQIFARITSENVGNRLAIVLDGKVYSAPVIREAITGGSAEISGNFSPEEARLLAGVIESGNLPVSIGIDSEFGTDPTLGRDSIRSGVQSVVWGMLAVVVFMIAYYRFAGVVAILALIGNLFLVLGTLALTGATVTLPGIAGVVLTIGMAVDANVLIFERIREELANGKTLANAIKSGYGRAFVTILDSNLTTLLTGLILYRFGTGPIRGFAVTLCIGIVASMFTALFMTRAIFDLGLYLNRIKRLSMMQMFSHPSFDFLGARRIAATCSIVLVVVSLAHAAYRGRSALSIDFAGGTEVTYRYQAEGAAAEVAAVRALLDAAGYKNARVGYKFSAAQEGRLLELVLPDVSTDDEGLDFDALTALLTDGVPGVTFEQVQTNSVGGLVGAQFQFKAILAALLAAAGIILYISFRYEVAYGVAAVVALLHDVVIAGGVYLLFGRQLSLPVVAALLTIMGYSLNDTIVVFDRIREDLALHKGRTYHDIINLSINQTLSRTVLTSLTTLIVVVTLFLFGGGAINDFALVMLVGIVVGTYSSVFVATAIIASWHKRARGHAEA